MAVKDDYMLKCKSKDTLSTSEVVELTPIACSALLSSKQLKADAHGQHGRVVLKEVADSWSLWAEPPRSWPRTSDISC